VNEPLAWAARALGVEIHRAHRIRTAGEAGAGNDVWRLEVATGDPVFLKRHGAARRHAQEVRATELWASRLGASPRLLASDAKLRLALLGAAPGEPGEEFRADPSASPLRDAAAGAFLARLHALPSADDDPVPLAAAIARRARAWAERARGALDAAVVDAVVARCAAPWPADVPAPRRVPCHRDFGPHNWLFGPAGLRVIDWEHAREDSAAADVDRALASPSVDGAALLEGYGALAPSLAEELRRVTPLSALAQVAWAAERGDLERDRAGRARLALALTRPR